MPGAFVDCLKFSMTIKIYQFQEVTLHQNSQNNTLHHIAITDIRYAILYTVLQKNSVRTLEGYKYRTRIPI